MKGFARTRCRLTSRTLCNWVPTLCRWVPLSVCAAAAAVSVNRPAMGQDLPGLDASPTPAAAPASAPAAHDGGGGGAAAAAGNPQAPTTLPTDLLPSSPPIAGQSLPPTGYAGGSLLGGGASSSRLQGPSDFLPVPDRWRIGLPENYVQNERNSSIFNPYGQNVLKGDYPIIGQDKFLIITATSDTLFEARKLPTPSGQSTRSAGSFVFYGEGDQDLVSQNFIFSAELFQGDASYKPKDWAIRFTGVYNYNYVSTQENQVINPDVRQRSDRTADSFGVQELFYEQKLADLSSNYDFVSVRAGTQGFTSDFRGFLFSDNEPGVRLFGNYDNNKLQFNLAWFYMLEKDTNTGLNTFTERDQNVFIANVFRQDFLVPGYTTELSFHANLDGGQARYDRNGNIVRPEPIGTIHEKNLQAFYIGWGGDGHIGRINVSHQFYQVLGEESFNAIAGKKQSIDAQFAALELSYDQDYIRYRASVVYASGDENPTDGKAKGFDSIFDNPNFIGGGFSLFTRQAIRLTGTGVGLVGRNSFFPDLRTSKEEGQANFVNPGLLAYNAGVDFDITPRVKVITNVSWLQFVNSNVLAYVLQDNHVPNDIGLDYGVGVEYRPLLNNNIILTAGAAALTPGRGFQAIYTSATLYSLFGAVTLTY